MSSDIKRHCGGQPGNRNACKHGYYCSAFSGVSKADLIEAGRVSGLDEEIALLRAHLKAVVRQSLTNVRLISEAASTLVRLIRAREKLGLDQAARLEQPAREDIDGIIAGL